MSKTRDPMRRHFCITLWRWRGKILEPAQGHFDLAPVLSDIIETGRTCRAHYIAWSLEDARLEQMPTAPSGLSMNDGAESPVASGEAPEIPDPPLPPVTPSAEDNNAGLHVHVYIELERSIRWSTVKNRFGLNFDGAHVEVRRGWRMTAREYHMGLKHGDEKPTHITHGEWGDWRPDTGDSTPDAAEVAASMILAGQSPKSVARAFPMWFIRHGAGVIRLRETIHGRRWGGWEP